MRGSLGVSRGKTDDGVVDEVVVSFLEFVEAFGVESGGGSSRERHEIVERSRARLSVDG